VVLTADPLAAEASAILGIGVEATFADGVISSGGP
jgi:hypothetical protein